MWEFWATFIYNKILYFIFDSFPKYINYLNNQFIKKASIKVKVLKAPSPLTH